MRFALFVLGLLVFPGALDAQWTLAESVRRAGENYAGVQVSLEQAASAAAALEKARTSYLPRGDFYAQLNRATRNNVFGMLLPNPVIPSISGPPLAENAGTNVWGSATGFLVTWEPFDLGQRPARLSTADAARIRAERGYARTRFEVEAAAADAFLTVLAADEMVRNARAAAERSSSIEKVIQALARAGLKPDADAARARAEVASAQAQLIQAEQAARTARVSLAQLAGGSWENVQPSAAFSRRDAPAGELLSNAQSHPARLEQQSAVREAESRLKEMDTAWRPRFQIQSALYARGTGANPDGTTGGAGSGIGPSIYNWGLGFSILFPFLDLPSIRAQRMAESHNAAAESARFKKLDQDLNAQLERARAALDGARRVAQTTPALLEAARATHEQARARYQAGLATILEVADAQRLLLQAEIDGSLARLNIWRAHLAIAIAAGDLKPFLEAANP